MFQIWFANISLYAWKRRDNFLILESLALSFTSNLMSPPIKRLPEQALTIILIFVCSSASDRFLGSIYFSTSLDVLSTNFCRGLLWSTDTQTHHTAHIHKTDATLFVIYFWKTTSATATKSYFFVCSELGSFVVLSFNLHRGFPALLRVNKYLFFFKISPHSFWHPTPRTCDSSCCCCCSCCVTEKSPANTLSNG